MFLDIGDGNIGTNITNDQFKIPNDILVFNFNDPIHLITKAIYGDLLEKYQNDKYFRDRAIITPTLDDVHRVNEMLIRQMLIRQLPGDEMIYLISNSICKHDENAKMLTELYTSEILNFIKGSRLPNHIIRPRLEYLSC